ETSELCQWHIPAAHELESWGDARAFDGTASLRQPLIEPLYGGKSELELLAVFFEHIDAAAYDLVRERWKQHLPGDFEASWRKALHDGVIAATAEPPVTVSVNAAAVQRASAEIQKGAAAAGDGVALLFRPDPTIYDGRFAHNGWLQELPKHPTKLVWDNALIVGPRTAERLGLQIDDVVEVSSPAGGRGRIRAAVWVQPGHADGCATLHLGYGRWRAGRVASGHGANAYALRTSANLWLLPGAGIRKTGDTFTLACTQNHHLLESGEEEIPTATREAAVRQPVRTGTLAEWQADPNFVHAKPKGEETEATSLYPPYKYEGYKWAM